MSSPKQSFAYSSSLAHNRKYQTLKTSRNRTSTSSLKKLPSSSAENCIFCNKKNHQSRKDYFPSMINKALFSKYSSSQNYYFTKDINEILSNSRTPFIIRYKDCLTNDEEEEYLKRFYKANEYDYKLRMLTEYYKFHKDISRLFMLPTTNILNKYHDKKRKLEYMRVTKLLHEENESKNPSPKPKEKPRKEEKPVIIDRILENLEISHNYHDNRKLAEPKKGPNHAMISSNKNMMENPTVGRLDLQRGNMYPGQRNNLMLDNRMANRIQDKAAEYNQQLKRNQHNQSNNQSVSNTINDLNLKLGEIIANNSRNYGNYFDTATGGIFQNQTNTNEPFLNESISNLSNFLNFLKANAQHQKLNDIPEINPPDGFQTISVPATHRKNEIDNLTLSQQFNHHSRAKSQSPAELLIPSSINLARKLYPSYTGSGNLQLNNNYVGTAVHDEIRSSPSIGDRFDIDRPPSMNNLAKGQMKSIYNFESKIKNFDEALKRNDQNAAFKIHSSQTSQRSISRESKRTSLTSQNHNTSEKNSTTKTFQNLEPGSREPSISKNTNVNNLTTAKTNNNILTRAASNLNMKQVDSITRSNLGSTQSSVKSATKLESSPSLGNQNNFLSLGKTTYSAANMQSEKLLKKSHVRINSENVGGLMKNGIRAQPVLGSALKMSLPLTSQNFFGPSSNNFNQNGALNPQTVRETKNYDTYDQYKQPSSLKGSLSRRNFQQSGLSNEVNTFNSNPGEINKVSSIEAFNQNYGDQMVFDSMNSARPISIHKYTKSESKYNKLESQKRTEADNVVQEPLIHRKFFQESNPGANQPIAAKLSSGDTPTQNSSSTKQLYTYNQNNVVNIYLQDTQKDPNIVIKAETERFGNKNGNFAFGQPLASKTVTKKIFSPDGTTNQQGAQKFTLNPEAKISLSNGSPVKISKKVEFTTTVRCKNFFIYYFFLNKLAQKVGLTSGMSTATTNFTKKHSKIQL